MGAAEEIVSYRDISKLSSHGGHIEITKTWAKSLLQRMGFVKKKSSMSGKISLAQFDESKEIFLADVAAKVLMKDIPEPLIINWDQTGLSIVPTILRSDGPAVFSPSKSIIGNSAWFFKAFFLDDGLLDDSESSLLLDGMIRLHSNSIGGTVCTSRVIFIIIIIELQILKISFHGICIPPCGRSYKYW